MVTLPQPQTHPLPFPTTSKFSAFLTIIVQFVNQHKKNPLSTKDHEGFQRCRGDNNKDKGGSSFVVSEGREGFDRTSLTTRPLTNLLSGIQLTVRAPITTEGIASPAQGHRRDRV